jgi:branched-chain amino acid transport system ATP-binding protein
VTILSVEGLTKRFGGLLAVDGASFDVDRGSIHGLIGPNGSGKSTIFHLVTGVHPPTAGLVRFQDVEITGWRPDRIVGCGLARTFQEIQLFYDMTVLENAVVGAHRLGRSGIFAALARPPGTRAEEARVRERALGWLSLLGLHPYRDEAARTISYGHQRLLEISRALASDPEMVMLDEPAAGMNHAEAGRLSEHIHAIRDRGVTVLLVEHNVKMVMRLCSRITVLSRGRVIADDAPEAVQRNEAVLEAYLGRKHRA